MKTKNKKPSVVVAIPVFNEEKNIVAILKAINNQNKNNFHLKNTVVYSDGSIDDTVKLIKQNFRDVAVYAFRKNIGKNKRVNQILNRVNSDVLILMDADIKFSSKNVFDNLVRPYTLGSNPGITCAYHTASLPVNLFGKMAYFGFRVWDNARNGLGETGKRYYCEGGLRAFSNEFVKKFKLPEKKHVSEDSYSFYFAVSNGFEVKVAKNAKVYIDLPSNFRDYKRQMSRFLKAPGMIMDNFDKNIVEKYETINSYVKLKTFTLEFIKSPIIASLYAVLQIYVKTVAAFYKPSATWIPVKRK